MYNTDKEYKQNANSWLFGVFFLILGSFLQVTNKQFKRGRAGKVCGGGTSLVSAKIAFIVI